MKIYFAGSIRGGRKNTIIYNTLIKYLQKYGTVLTKHVGDKKLTKKGEIKNKDSKIYKRDINWIEQSDLLIADVSVPSLGVGYEIATAENMKKKILCIYKRGKNCRLSAMIAGNKKLKVCVYRNTRGILQIIDKYFTKMK